MLRQTNERESLLIKDSTKKKTTTLQQFKYLTKFFFSKPTQETISYQRLNKEFEFFCERFKPYPCHMKLHAKHNQIKKFPRLPTQEMIEEEVKVSVCIFKLTALRNEALMYALMADLLYQPLRYFLNNIFNMLDLQAKTYQHLLFDFTATCERLPDRSKKDFFEIALNIHNRVTQHKMRIPSEFLKEEELRKENKITYSLKKQKAFIKKLHALNMYTMHPVTTILDHANQFKAYLNRHGLTEFDQTPLDKIIRIAECICQVNFEVYDGYYERLKESIKQRSLYVASHLRL